MRRFLTCYFNRINDRKHLFQVGILAVTITFISLFMESCIKDNLSFMQLKGKYDTWHFATFGDTAQVNILPDFSFAGYEKNEKSIPLVPVKIILHSVAGDNTERIQQAIDKISNLPPVNGFRGTVLLKSGTYHLDNTLHITASGVVLRGEGQGVEGTILVANKPERYNLIEVSGSGVGLKQTGKGLSPIKFSGVAIGSTKIPVENSRDFNVGDSIAVVKTTNQDWLKFIGMAQLGWVADNYQIAHKRIIKAIEGDTLIVNIPMVDAIGNLHGGGYVATISLPGRIHHCGVENMRLQCAYTSDSLNSHAYIAVLFSRVTNSWVRNISAYHFGLACVELSGESDFNTIQDCGMIDPLSELTYASKYSFFIRQGMGNLFQRCYAKNGYYDFLLTGGGNGATGPNVYLDCYSDNFNGDSGPHDYWTTGTLFDNVVAGVLQARNSGSQGTDHGWTGAQTMFWNCKVLQGLDVQSPPGGVNWAVGCQGPWRNVSNAFWKGWGIPVQPRSLFLDQLKKRLGDMAVNRITSVSQRGEKAIWNELNEWGGQGHPLVEFPK